MDDGPVVDLSLGMRDAEVLLGYVSSLAEGIRNDGIETYPQVRDPQALAVATAQIQMLVRNDGRGQLSTASARLVAEILSSYLDEYGEVHSPDEAGSVRSILGALDHGPATE